MTGVPGTDERAHQGQKGLSSSPSSAPFSHVTLDKSLLSLLCFPHRNETPLGAPRLQPPARRYTAAHSTPRRASKGRAGGALGQTEGPWGVNWLWDGAQGGCCRVNCVPLGHYSPDPWNLRVWPYLEMGSS